MIICGYQGVGKSTLANDKSKRYIDLESGNFWVDGKRISDWYKVYVQIAVHLSKQNYTVFLSSHALVREYLKTHNDGEEIAFMFPSLQLKGRWIKRLEDRYERTGSDKDQKALLNAREMYDSSINELLADPTPKIIIKDTEYDLDEIIRDFKKALNK